MKNLWSKGWFKAIVIIVGLIVLFFVFTFSQNRQSLQSAIEASNLGNPLAGIGKTALNFPMPDTGSADEMVPSSYMIRDAGAGTTSATDAKIIQTGNITIEVKEIRAGLDGIKAVASTYSGFVIGSNYYESPSGQRSGTAQIKVPFKDFDNAMQDLKKLATFVGQETTNSQDVTEEYTDLQSNLRNLKAEEEQYLQIMRQAVKIQDILDVANKLYDVRGRIEQTQGRINYLNARTDYSVINIQLTEKYEVRAPENKWRPWEQIKYQTKQMIVRLQGFVDNMIAFIFWLVSIVPYLIVLAIVAWIIKVIIRRLRRSKNSGQANNTGLNKPN